MCSPRCTPSTNSFYFHPAHVNVHRYEPYSFNPYAHPCLQGKKPKPVWVVLADGSLFWYRSQALEKLKGDMRLSGDCQVQRSPKDQQSLVVEKDGKARLTLGFKVGSHSEHVTPQDVSGVGRKLCRHCRHLCSTSRELSMEGMETTFMLACCSSAGQEAGACFQRATPGTLAPSKHDRVSTLSRSVEHPVCVHPAHIATTRIYHTGLGRVRAVATGNASQHRQGPLRAPLTGRGSEEAGTERALAEGHCWEGGRDGAGEEHRHGHPQ